MENRQQQILSEIKSMMASVRSQLEMLDTKMAELQQIVDPEDFVAESIDIDIEMDDVVEETATEVVTLQEIPLEEPTVEDLPEADEPVAQAEPEPESESQLEPEPELEPESEPQLEPESESQPVEEPVKIETSIEEDIPESIFAEPEVVTVATKAKAAARPSINDMMADNCAWRHDMPGPTVKDIRSAISLNDRVIFINLLFDEDAQTFVNTLAHINTLGTLDQAVEYITSQFPSWDMNSDLVYRFMMAVRRKVK